MQESLAREFAQQTQQMSIEGSSTPPAINEVEIFEKVLGSRRGIIRGIGPKPRRSVSMADNHGSKLKKKQQTGTLAFTPENMEQVFQTPQFQECMMKYYDVVPKFPTNRSDRNDDEESDDDEEGDDEH